MKIFSVRDPEFRAYGQLPAGYDTAELLAAMNAIPLPAQGTAYEPSVAALEACAVFAELRDRGFGGMPVQLGICLGRNTRLNCLEYHRDSEINIGTDDFILLLARREEIAGWTLDTSKVKAFRVPAGVPVEIFATTLHYAPCHTDPEKGFRVAVALPRGTNTAKPDAACRCGEDALMTARNKWLLAHPDSAEAGNGARAALTGENLDVAADL